MSPARLDHREPRWKPEPIGFFRGAIYAVVFSAWAILLIAVLTTSL